jgi:Flp pilus assembly protein TadB
VVVSEDDLARRRIAELEARVAEHQDALNEAINARHEYLYRNAFGMARLLMTILASIGSGVFAFGAYKIALQWLPSSASILVGFATFFVFVWLLQKGSKRKLAEQMEKDAETFPPIPIWHAEMSNSDG